MHPIKPLGEISTLIMGQSPKSETYNTEKVGLPFYQGKKEFGELFPIPEVWCSEPIKIVEKNDILISVRAPVGPTNLCQETSCIGRGLAGVRPDYSSVELGFLRYFFKKYETEIVKLGKGSTFASITKSDLENLQIPLPPLPTQQKIVEKLDTVLEKIEKNIELTKQNLANIEEQNKSILEKIFSECEEEFGVKKLGDIFDITSSKRVFKSEWKSEGVPFYRAREIVKLANYKFVENELFISRQMFEEYKNKYGIPTEGDIMVTGVGTLGIAYVVNKEDEFYFKDGNILWMKKINNEVNSRFIEYGFLSEFIKKQVNNVSGTSVGTYTIIRAKNTIIPLPPLPKQQEIVNYLDSIFEKNSKLKNLYEKNLKNLEELKQSVLKEAFESEDFIQ